MTRAISSNRSAVPFSVLALSMALTVPFVSWRILQAGSTAAFGANWEQMAIARSLAAGRGFSNPYGYLTGPTAHCAPAHPAMLAAILSIWGDSPAAVTPALVAEVAIQSLCMLLLLHISVSAFSSWIPGAIAAFAMLLATRPIPQWESSMAWLALEAVFLCAQLGFADLWIGTMVGLSWLVSPSLAPASLGAVWLLRGRKSLTVSTAVAIIVILPWTVRNWTVLHAPIFLRDNFGLELFISNNDLAGPRQQDAEAERYSLWHPGTNPAIAAELASTGEPFFFRRMQSDALRWIQRHPARFLRLAAARIRLWWAPDWLVAAINALGVAGLWRNRHTTAGRAAATGLLLFPLPYYAIQYDPRYTYPILWLGALMAGDACHRLGRRFSLWYSALKRLC
jgi:hypothetical protein